MSVDELVTIEMIARGFHRSEDRPGHWRSQGGYGHDLEFRHRTVANWIKHELAVDGPETAAKKLRGKIDFHIEKQVR